MAGRGKHGPALVAAYEFELLDTGIFEQDRYFDIQIEYAKASPEDICIRIEAIESRAGVGSASPDPAVVVSEHMVLGR